MTIWHQINDKHKMYISPPKHITITFFSGGIDHSIYIHVPSNTFGAKIVNKLINQASLSEDVIDCLESSDTEVVILGIKLLLKSFGVSFEEIYEPMEVYTRKNRELYDLCSTIVYANYTKSDGQFTFKVNLKN